MQSYLNYVTLLSGVVLPNPGLIVESSGNLKKILMTEFYPYRFGSITRQLLTRHFKNESFMAAAVEKGTWTATVCVSPEHALGGKTVYKMLVFRTWILKETPHVQPAKPYTLVLRVCIPHQAASVAPGSL